MDNFNSYTVPKNFEENIIEMTFAKISLQGHLPPHSLRRVLGARVVCLEEESTFHVPCECNQRSIVFQ